MCTNTPAGPSPSAALAPSRPAARLALAAAVALAAGCGTTRMTDTQRTATEQLLISNAIDQAVSQLDVRPLAGREVFLDVQPLDGTVDKGYLVSTLRQHLLANGCRILEDRSKATLVVEARSGGVGSDRHSLLVGVPQTTVPAFLPGQPTQIPEIPFARKTDQNGVAKIAAFAYDRRTGRPVWQSGVVQSLSTARDVWVLGTGPFQNGTIRHGTEFAGEPLPVPLPHAAAKGQPPAPEAPRVAVTQAATWPEPAAPGRGEPAEGGVLTGLASAFTAFARALESPAAVRPDRPGGPSKATPPVAPNTGGIAETEPRQVLSSGLGVNSGG
jgi:hypothetical protein